jgi:hypothetical protein
MGIFLDLTEAFDVIIHKLLHAKLELYVLREKIHSWMSLSYWKNSVCGNTSGFCIGTPFILVVYK